MIKKFYLLFTIILMSISGYCQPAPQNWNWYFGVNAALNFSSGNPVFVSGSVMNQWEGCASISDSLGNLLFYTDGVSVWNKNNDTMPHGTGLYGNFSTTQSALIVPKPDSLNIYYIFNAGLTYDTRGLRYSEVDMSLDSGRGDVTLKNIQLVTPTSEKVCGVRHSNGIYYWVIAHGYFDSSFYSYQISPLGVLPPVISNIGVDFSDWGYSEGYIKASPNGRKVAIALGTAYKVQLFDFDNSTGILSNCISIPFPNFGNSDGPYGVSFSPDNNKLYVNDYYYPGQLQNVIYQFDISSGNQSTIIASQYVVDTLFHPYATGALQLGPDNKLYVCEHAHSFLSVINKPNIPGAGCNFVFDAIDLYSGSCRIGLPNFIDFDSLQTTFFIRNFDTSVCSNTLIIDATNNGEKYLWSTGDSTHSISVSNSGSYWVKIYGANIWNLNAYIVDTFHVNMDTVSPTPIISGNNSFCSQDSIILNAGSFIQYLWNNGSTTQTITIDSANIYLVTVTDGNGCTGTASKTVTVNPLPTPVITPGGPTTFCQGDSISLTAGIFSSYLWNTASTTQSIVVANQATFTVNVTDSNGCTSTASITDSVIPPPNVISSFTVDTLSGCKPLHVHFTNTSINATSYHWEFTGGGTSDSINPTRIFSASGTYTATLIAYDSTTCGIFTDTSSQTYYYTVFIPPSQPHIIQNGDTLTITNYTTGLQWYKDNSPITGATNPVYIVQHTGCYQAIETDTNGCTSKSDTICFSFTGIPSISDNHGISIYPNPNDGTFMLSINSEFSPLSFQFIISNILGQEIYKQTLSGTDNTIDISKWSEGLYFYELISNNAIARGKFIKE